MHPEHGLSFTSHFDTFLVFIKIFFSSYFCTCELVFNNFLTEELFPKIF